MRLELLLESADETQPETILAFYRELLSAEVLVPKSPVASSALQLGAIDAFGFLIAGTADHPVLPVFTSLERLIAWSGEELPFEERSFLALARVAPTQLTIHLNPGAETGKEFNSWELSKLSLGEDALDELLFEICEDTGDGSMEHGALPEDLRSAMPRWASILESYPDVTAGYCALVQSPAGDGALVLFGFEMEDRGPELLQKIEDEIRSAAPDPLGLRTIRIDPAAEDPLAALVRQGELVYTRRSE